ncbi:SMP-30/gluconolactonase/LRE family protein [Psychrosphaera sp. 1_MG-2023]|uniref:SMP-30/gluconolactonase/LRE family protein n=1 Tax=Psychrosphaera sp. 1_MG-2023 TaxID=3062643 RepID=UPI0026E3C4DC|nr:SMP-30/gluconolactonase/LRE family protein [Psychrosphaera sp. 1_MG-2023]MDO6721227.1 SMP-30/gluconolactonase/LRE family protein [Psychrosphaera sp. 1_MG-2023]
MLLTNNFVKATTALLALLIVSGTSQAMPQPATLFANLPQQCVTPDAFDVAPNGSLTLSCPNFANRKLQGELFSLTQNGTVKHLATVPSLSLKTKANPMGIAYGPDGGLYIADSRGAKHGRILKMNFRGDTLISTEVIASGFNPNGLRFHNGYLYATQLNLPKVKSKTPTSGIYQFNATDRNVMVNNTLNDKQLIFTVESTTNKPGLDGIAFDSKGNLYSGHISDGTVYRFTFDAQQNISSQQIYAKVPAASGIDGMAFDSEDNLYLAGFAQNQILKIDTNKQVSVIAEYLDNDGSNGQLDQPADLIVYNNKLIISNFDLMVQEGFRNTKHSKPYTLSMIDLATINFDLTK